MKETNKTSTVLVYRSIALAQKVLQTYPNLGMIGNCKHFGLQTLCVCLAGISYKLSFNLLSFTFKLVQCTL